MSDEKNKRVVKKTNTKKMSIKVSTEDKETPSVNNLNKDKNKVAKNTKSDSQEAEKEIDLETRYSQLLETNKNLEAEIQNMKDELKSELERTMTEVGSLNNKLDTLTKEEVNVCNENKSLLSKLKKMDKEISTKFFEKFKMSKLVENKKNANYIKDKNNGIKSSENEKNNVQKDIKINQRDIDRLNKILENSKEGEEGKKLEELKQKIEIIQKEVNELNLIKLHHKNCPKDASTLKSRLNVLNNDIEFESKRKSMISVEPNKKEKEKSPSKKKDYISGNNRIQYGLKVENKLIKSTQIKYDSRQAYYLNQKSFNRLKDEMKEIENNKKSNSSEKLKKIDYNPEKVANNKLKEPQKPYLFTEVEKEIFKNIMPNEYFNNLNEKYSQKENEMKEIEEATKPQKELKMQLYLDNLRYEEIILKQREIKMKKANLMSKHTKNTKKILDMKTRIKSLQNEIDREAKKVTRMADYNNSINKVIKEYYEKMKKEKENEKNQEKDNE
jgi:hypothetical protein